MELITGNLKKGKNRFLRIVFRFSTIVSSCSHEWPKGWHANWPPNRFWHLEGWGSEESYGDDWPPRTISRCHGTGMRMCTCILLSDWRTAWKLCTTTRHVRSACSDNSYQFIGFSQLDTTGQTETSCNFCQGDHVICRFHYWRLQSLREQAVQVRHWRHLHWRSGCWSFAGRC